MRNAELIFRRAEDLLTRRVAGEVLIVPVKGRVADLDCVFTLDEVGSRVWEMVDGATRVGSIARALAAEYEVGAEEAERDVLMLLDEMEEAGLVRAGGAGEV